MNDLDLALSVLLDAGILNVAHPLVEPARVASPQRAGADGEAPERPRCASCQARLSYVGGNGVQCLMCLEAGISIPKLYFARLRREGSQPCAEGERVQPHSANGDGVVIPQGEEVNKS